MQRSIENTSDSSCFADSRDLADLVRISVILGENPAYIQGAGGNTSVKHDSRWMSVKASGVELKDVTADYGFVRVDFPGIRDYIPVSDEEESRFNTAMLSYLHKEEKGDPSKPSIEAGFHATLPAKFVLHSHSIYANIITCSKEGRKIAAELFDDFGWVRAAAPGRELILTFLREMKSHVRAPIIFLENHGFIATGETADEALHRHEEANHKIMEHLKLPQFDPGVVPVEKETMRAHVFFPDQVVYTTDETLAETKAAKETFATYAYLWNTLERIGLQPQFMSQKLAGVVSNMEAEKHRRKMAR